MELWEIAWRREIVKQVYYQVVADYPYCPACNSPMPRWEVTIADEVDEDACWVQCKECGQVFLLTEGWLIPEEEVFVVN